MFRFLQILSQPRVLGSALTLLTILPQCVAPSAAFGAKLGTSSTGWKVDPKLQPSPASVPGVRGGALRRVGASLEPSGIANLFVVGEVVLRTDSKMELADFLARYNGKVVTDSRVPLDLTNGAPLGDVDLPPWYLIAFDLAASPLVDLSLNLSAHLRLTGDLVFDSEATARTAALLLRELGERDVFLNDIFLPDASLEHPDGSGGNIDAAEFFWMEEDSDSFTPGDQGLSTGVVHAWQYLQYHGFPPVGSGIWDPPHVAIVDQGFALDPNTGEPQLGNLDFLNSPAAPVQYDLVDYDASAGGMAPGDSPWHGQAMFGVAAAYPRNFYGNAGVGGNLARPMLLYTDLSAAATTAAIGAAAFHGADVINMSFGMECGSFCELWWDDHFFFDTIKAAQDAWGSLLVASAGNGDDVNGYDLDATTYYPCELSRVVCVGAVDSNGAARQYSNFGSNVDIWAPDGIRTTVTPPSAMNPLGVNQLAMTFGTSPASAFVSGAGVLLRTLDPSLKAAQVRTLLASTANFSTDPKVVPGIIDVYRAVVATWPNQPPVVTILQPANGSSVSYLNMSPFVVDIADPEIDATGLSYPGLGGIVEIRSDLNGLLCMIDDSSVGNLCSPIYISTGSHQITARAIDPHGAVGSHTITLDVVNRPPQANIIFPADNSTFYGDQLATFWGEVLDFDGNGSDIAWTEWSSDLDGILASGSQEAIQQLVATLSEGTHQITFFAQDFLGASDSDTIQVTVRPATGVPTPLIDQPGHLDGFTDGQVILVGRGLDPEEGDLSGTSLVWTSSLDGFLGTGEELQVNLSGGGTCSLMFHTITLTVTDSDGNFASTSITVQAGTVC